MESTTGIIPENLMFPQMKKQVISFLIAQPLPSWTKRRLLEGWCVEVGVRCFSSQYHIVEASGVDQPGISFGEIAGD
jgi:hypothetical protein